MFTLRIFLVGAAILFMGNLAHAATISVTFSEHFAEKLADDYGEREGERLSAQIIRDLEEALEHQGATASRIAVVIEDAKPNRPTFEQLKDRPGLDPIRSVSIGGMELTGTAYDTEGNEIASMNYEWFENNIAQVIGGATWSDARRASDRFARRLAGEIAGE